MTYTFKLSRRLAVARLGSLVLLSGLLACSASDAPVGLQSQNPLDYSLATVHLTPSSVTAEVNQPVRLAAFGRNSLGDSMAVSDLTWSASGGTISPDGTFSANAPGTYTLTASSQHGQKTGHGRVVVLAPPVGLSAVVVSPDTATLYTHEQHAFAAVGLMSDGSETTIGVNWTASGGTIDAGGLYTAGPSGGTFRIVATNGSSGYADTAVVTILAPVVDTAATGGGTGNAAVDSVVIAPSGITLAPGSTQQFTATRYFSDGTHQFDGVTFSATGGSVSANGLYTAGASTGNFRVVATDPSSGSSDTAQIAIQAAIAPPPTGGGGATAGYPNRPAGLTRVCENSFEGIPGSGRGTEFAAGGGSWTTTRSEDMAVVSDPTALQSPSSVLRVRFPAGMTDGISPHARFDCRFDRPYKELYVSYRVKIVGSSFEDQAAPGAKLLGYISYGNTDRDNQFFLILQSRTDLDRWRNDPSTAIQSGPWSFMSDFTSRYAPPGSSNPAQDYKDNQGTGPQFKAGTWQQVELYFRVNDDGRENGIYKMWINGRLVQSHNTVTMINTALGGTMGFYDLHFDPVWGGNIGQVRTRNDDLLIDHIYISGTPQ